MRNETVSCELDRVEGHDGKFYSWTEPVKNRPARVLVFEIGGYVARVSLVNRDTGKPVDNYLCEKRTTHLYGFEISVVHNFFYEDSENGKSIRGNLKYFLLTELNKTRGSRKILLTSPQTSTCFKDS